MSTARTISIGMTLLGLLLIVIGSATSLGPVVTLSGMLLFVAGIVKIGMVAIWRSFFATPPPLRHQHHGDQPRSHTSPAPETEGS